MTDAERKAEFDAAREQHTECVLNPIFAAWWQEMSADLAFVIPEHHWKWQDVPLAGESP